MKKIVCAVLTVLLFLAPAITVRAVASQPSSWAEERIAQARERGLVPEALLSDYQAPVTREEFAMLVSKAYQKLSGTTVEPESGKPFTDTDNRDVLIAYKLKIVNGVGGTLFAPQSSITRQDVCVMLTRMIKALNADADITPPGDFSFADEDSIGSWATEHVKYLSSRGIISGVGGGKIDPLNSATREQAILLVLNLANRYPAFEFLDDALAALYIPASGDIYIRVRNVEAVAGGLSVSFDLVEKAYLTPAEFASVKAGTPLKKYGETFTYGSYHDTSSYYSGGKWVEVDKVVDVIYSDTREIFAWFTEGDKIRLSYYDINPTVFKTVKESLKGIVTQGAKITLLRFDDDVSTYASDMETLELKSVWEYQDLFAVSIKSGQWTALTQVYQS